MKILLLKPPLTLPDNFNGIARFAPPLGLGYIASVLEKNGYDVTILDTGIEKWKQINTRSDGVKYVGMNFRETAEYCKKFDVVGVTVLTVDAITAFEMCERIKKMNPQIEIIAGGPHICINPQQRPSFLDDVIVGEGEYSFIKLLKLEKRIFFNVVESELIENLDDLPFPARHLMNLDKYFEVSKYFQGSRNVKERSGSIITSRGCPYNCIFCSVRLSMGQKFRARSVENVVDELEEMVNKYKMEYILFEDDNFTLDRERIIKICDLIKQRGLKFKWGTPNGVRADKLDKELLIKMKESGLVDIIVSPESGNQFVVDNIIGKHLDLNCVLNVAKWCKELGIIFGAYFVIGNPGETLEQMEDTVRFADKIRELGGTPFCFIALPFYGTRLYNISKEKGYLLKDGIELEKGLLNMEAMIKTPDFTPEDLYKIRDRIQGKTHSNEIKEMILTRPLDSIRFFLARPKFIMKYFLRKLL